ncbi:MAG TPA: DUF4279 domain-containing protein [Verrucomicrobiae bacterium]|nr:DUF4279 domain-containing protein [Verrucomicrobiae bacterium]
MKASPWIPMAIVSKSPYDSWSRRNLLKVYPPHCEMSEEKKSCLQNDEFCVSLNISGDDLDPEELTRLLGASPTFACRRGDVIPRRTHDFVAPSGSWSISTERSTRDIEEQLTGLFSRLNDDLTVWKTLTGRFDASLFCGVFLSWYGRGFSMSPGLHRLGRPKPAYHV